jgi:hypothetical protein
VLARVELIQQALGIEGAAGAGNGNK